MYFKSISIFFFYTKNFKAIRNNVAYNTAEIQKEWLREATLSSPSRQHEHSSPSRLEETYAHGTTDWFQIGKGVLQGCILSPCLFNFYAEYIMRNVGLEEAQAGMKIAGRNINNLRYADDTTFMAESEEELKSLLMKVKVESESWLKAQHSENEDHGIWSHHFKEDRCGNSGNSVRVNFWGLQNHCR